MASNDGKIGCTTGRAKIIDPNDFNGFNSDSNVPVQLEDLNISVILTTYKKPRTNLTTTSDGSTFESSREFQVNFIEGTNLGGKKVLTTKYTDLTTSFEKGAVNEETLGITNIDIEFNSSMAPMVAISFIDVRGSSIFQNEENILNGYNKYSVFFQLPYPLFELEIKGYYGRPVKYCLHMLKFNSKFNSQTGNFEITCNFIGYSYALLSDTLLGYLKAIPYTKIGEERYTAYNSTRNTPILNLNELMKKIDDINKNLPKIADSAPESVELNSTTTALDRLVNIKDTMDTFATSMPELNIDKENHDYIVFKTTDLQTKANEIKIYKDDVTKYIESGEDSFNKLSEKDKIELKNFISLDTNTTALGAKVYKSVTKKMFTSNTDATLTTALGTQSNLEEKKQKISDYLTKNYGKVGDDEILDIIDFSLQYEEVNNKRKTTEKANEDAKKALAKKFEESVRDTLGFEPTVREIVEIFTAAIEVFIETIYVVSTAAEGNPERTEELAKKFTATGSQSLETDIYNANIELKKFFPWPDYREKDDEKNTYVEKYLGASGVLESPEKVDELVFIEDLLNAFRKAKKIEDAIVENQDSETTAWFASNPLDSVVFSDKEPYSRYSEGAEFKTREDFVRLLLIRGMTFLGYSNDPAVLQPEEIKAMGEVEAQAILRGIKTVDTSSGTLKQSLTKITLDFIKDVEGTINGSSRKVIEKEGSDYKYTYIYNGNEFRLIPVNKGFNDENWGNANKEYLQVLTDLITKRDVDEYLFLTNYSDDYTPVTAASKPVEESQQRKNDDGGTYVKFFKGTEFPKSSATYTLPEGVTSDNVMILEKLKQDAVTFDAGFNSFAGGYGAQDFSVMDWGNEELTDLPLMYVFYNDYPLVDDSNPVKLPNGLTLSRKQSAEEKGKTDTNSLYDFKATGNIKTPAKGLTSKAFFNTNQDASLHLGWGENRRLFKKYDDSVSYPYVMLKYEDTLLFSLFGSELYYNQSFKGRFKNYNRALLFLHSLPFNKVITGSAIGDPDGVFTDNPFGPNEITHLFDSKAGFVHAPRLWCAYIGGILWRQSVDNPIYDDSGTKIIGGGSGSDDPIAWNVNYDDNNKVNVTDTPSGYSYLFEVPNKNTQYLPSNIEFIGSRDNYNDYVDINKQFDIWPNLPRQIKNAFKKAFFDFVNGEDGMTSFDQIISQLEIYNGTGDQFHNYLGIIHSKIKDKDTLKPYISATDLLNSPYLNVDAIKNNYEVMVPLLDDDAKFFMFLEIKDGSEGARVLKKALTEEFVIANNSYAAWVGSDAAQGQITRKPIKVSSTNFDLYFKSVIDALSKEGDDFSPTKEQQNLDISIFGTANKDLIRLNLYRTCKNIYDKWLGGATNVDKVMYQCGGRSSVDAKLASKYNNSATKFIDSFRFVSRSFRDIGDKLYINPLPINDFLIGNPNTSSYDAISSLLAANNFEFQALPNFINFNDDETLKSIFKPYSYYDGPIKEGICGPSFVCVYVGQTSKHLDFRGGEYPNDGFDLRCINGSPSIDIPPDFNEASNDYEDAVGAFTVRYSQQNQNIFKDINLDQSEFSETDESLQIQDDISQKGAENNRSFVGQNIYNVYAVRSYSAEIEMMGNAMIQPMMYFQLDNIPMFHGAYMVTRVKHSIKPNSMSTNFKGVRIRYPETPLITAYDIYMDLIATLDTSGAGTGTFGGDTGGFNNYINKYYGILTNNKPTEKTIEGSKIPNPKIITKRGEEELEKWKRGSIKESSGLAFLEVYVKTTPGFSAADYANNSQPWSAIFISYMMSGGDSSFPKSALHYTYVTKAMNGENGYEAFPLKTDLKIKVEIGDLLCQPRSGGFTASHCDCVYKVSGDKVLLVGGNLGDSVKEMTLTTSSGYLISSSNVDKYQILLKKTDNKYYNGKKLSNLPSGDGSSSQSGCPAIGDKKTTKQSGVKSSIDKIINGTYNCSSGRDCKGSFEGLKQVPSLWSNNKLTKRGVIAMSQGVNEGFGTSPNCKNPGNIRGTGCNGFQKYGSWKEGWVAYSEYLNDRAKSGWDWSNSKPNCYLDESNKSFKEAGLKFKESASYSYTKNSSPSLRQYINFYAPWGDSNNPINYISSIAITLKGYGYTIDIDEPMSSWV